MPKHETQESQNSEIKKQQQTDLGAVHGRRDGVRSRCRRCPLRGCGRCRPRCVRRLCRALSRVVRERRSPRRLVVDDLLCERKKRSCEGGKKRGTKTRQRGTNRTGSRPGATTAVAHETLLFTACGFVLVEHGGRAREWRMRVDAKEMRRSKVHSETQMELAVFFVEKVGKQKKSETFTVLNKTTSHSLHIDTPHSSSHYTTHKRTF